MKICAQRLINRREPEVDGLQWMMERNARPGRSYSGARFHIESAHAAIGVHHEYFLHHRRSGSYHLCCKLLGSARLNR